VKKPQEELKEINLEDVGLKLVETSKKKLRLKLIIQMLKSQQKEKNHHGPRRMMSNLKHQKS